MGANATQRIEHRWHERCETRFPVTLRASGPKPYQCMAENIASDGIYLQFQGDCAPLHPGSGVELEFKVRQSGESAFQRHKVVGVVAHCRDSGVGIMLANCTPRLDQLFRAIRRNQNRLRKTQSL